MYDLLTFKNLKKLHKKYIKNAEFRKEYAPRLYNVPPTHHDPSFYGLMEFSTEKAKNGEGFKGYNINDDVITKCSKAVRVKDIKCPIDAGFLALPKAFIKHQGSTIVSDGKMYDVIGFAFAKSFDVQTITQRRKAIEKGKCQTDGRYYDNKISQAINEIHNSNDEKSKKEGLEIIHKYAEMKYNEPCYFVDSIVISIPLSNGEVLVGSYPCDGEQTIEEMLERYKDDFTQDQFLHETELDEDKTQDVNLIQQCCKLAFGILLYMTSKYDGVEESQKLFKNSKSNAQNKYNRKEKLWSPNWLKKESSSESKGTDSIDGSKVRYHWRRGYFGLRWYGKNRSKSRVVWVEPYPVNKDLK